ncbi:MAG: alpha/beta fold hydrolase [Spirochaetota bacterium]
MGILKNIVTLLAVVSVLGCILLYWKQEALVFFPKRLAADHQYSFPFAFREYTISVSKAQLSAIHATVPNAKGLIVYFHGNAGDLSNWGMVAANFLPLGWELLIIDYRGYGKSTGTIQSEAQLLQDAKTVYKKARELYPAEQIVIYGRSIGTGIATYLASQEQVKALILETPYYSLSSLAKLYYPFIPSFLLRYKLKTFQWIHALTCPVYMVHGSSDEIIPLENGKRLSQVIQGEHEFLEIPGGSHNNLSQFPEFQNFLKRILQ